MSKKILHLTLKKKWFDLIKAGEKKVEYREGKDYWITRLLNKNGSVKIFDEVHFKNGYNKNSPHIKVKWKGLKYIVHKDKLYFAIMLGEILDVGD